MSTYLGKFFKTTGMSTSEEVQVNVLNCEFFVDVVSAVGTKEKSFLKGDTVIDPVTDDELTIVACSKSGFYVEDYRGDRKILPLKETLLFNL